MRTNFSPAQLDRSASRRGREESARLRPLRHLHGDVSDLCAARRRARRAARPHRDDAEHAGGGRRAIARDRAACRSLPVVPRLPHGLSVERRLCAAGRRGARAYPDALSPAARRQAAALADRDGDAAAGAVRAAWSGASVRAARDAAAGPLGAMARMGAHARTLAGNTALQRRRSQCAGASR